MRCNNCGKENREGNKFCSKCGTKLEERVQMSEDDFNAEMRKIAASINQFESEKTSQEVYVDDFENEETVILDDSNNDVSDFENDETVILDNEETPDTGEIPEIEVASDAGEFFEDEATVIIQDDDPAPPAAPTFDYRSVYKEYRTTEEEETAYIDHLRKLKELLEDGIITEDEFTRKKQQILGL